jgi:hypothetical protein
VATKTTKDAEVTETTAVDNSATKTDDTKANAEEARELPVQRVRTVDSAEHNIGWTVQHPAPGEPPQPHDPIVYPKSKLATVEGLRAQGIDPATYYKYFDTTDKDGAEALATVKEQIKEQADESAKVWDEVEKDEQARYDKGEAPTVPGSITRTVEAHQGIQQ